MAETVTPTKDSVATPTRPGLNGGTLRSGNPGNKGGGRETKKWAEFLAALRESPDVQDAIEKAAKDGNNKGFAPVLKVLTDYDPEKPIPVERKEVAVSGAVVVAWQFGNGREIKY